MEEEKQKLDRVKREKLKQLKERARHFEPFVPKITSAYHIKKQSSLSVLQSFTSAVQQLCSPEKTPTKTSSHPGSKASAVVALEQRSESRIQSQIPESSNQTIRNRSQESRIQNRIPESRNQNPESGNRNPESRNQNPESRQTLHPSNMARSETGDGVAVKRA